MAGETIKTEAICLAIHPWSQTSHVVSWLTPAGRVVTVVKGAVRPKSAFLGQYDLNYTCEITYYARARGDVHPLRECAPLRFREGLRDDFRSLALAGHFRRLSEELAPDGPDARAWFERLESALDRLAGLADAPPDRRARIRLVELLGFEGDALSFAGLAPDYSGFDPAAEWSPFSIERGAFDDGGGRILRIPAAVARCLRRPEDEKNTQILLDAARVIGVFYQFHLDSPPESRRAVLGILQENEPGR